MKIITTKENAEKLSKAFSISDDSRWVSAEEHDDEVTMKVDKAVMTMGILYLSTELKKLEKGEVTSELSEVIDDFCNIIRCMKPHT